MCNLAREVLFGSHGMPDPLAQLLEGFAICQREGYCVNSVVSCRIESMESLPERWVQGYISND